MHFLQWIKKEIISIIPAIIYFAIAFNLIYIATGLMLAPGTKRTFSQLTVTIGALVVGKVLLIANSFPFIDLFPNKPLIYNITWKFFFYNFCVILFWIIEKTIHGCLIEHDSIGLIQRELLRDFNSPIFWSAQIGLWMVFLVFIVFRELMLAIGKKKTITMLFGVSVFSSANNN